MMASAFFPGSTIHAIQAKPRSAIPSSVFNPGMSSSSTVTPRARSSATSALATHKVDSGPLWQPRHHAWDQRFENLPVAAGRKLLLVPKVIVRRRMDYDQDKYYSQYLLTYLQDVHLDANTELVHLLKNGDRRVYKRILRQGMVAAGEQLSR